MPAGKKLILTAAGVVVLAAGGYLGAQAVVGNEVEKALSQTFAQLDESFSWYANDVTIDKSLFTTTVTATIGMVGVEDANARVNLLVDHGVINSPITGTIHPNEQFLRGDIDVDLIATRKDVTGQLTTSALNGVDLDGGLKDLVVDLDLEDKDIWRIDGQAREIVINNESDSFRIVSPRFQNHSQEASSLIHQHLEIPRIEFLAQGLSIYMDGVELEAASESVNGSQVVNSAGHFKIADMGADDSSIGSFSMDIDAKSWDMSAFQAYQEAYVPLADIKRTYAENGVRGDEQQERDLLAQAIESGYDVLSASPSIALQPMEAHIVLPMLGIDFNPRLMADIRFDGDDLSREALYSVFWDSRFPLPEPQQSAGNTMSPAEAEEYLASRVSLDISVTTPPPLVMTLIPFQFSMLINPELEEQQLLLQEGSLIINGEKLM